MDGPGEILQPRGQRHRHRRILTRRSQQWAKVGVGGVGEVEKVADEFRERTHGGSDDGGADSCGLERCEPEPLVAGGENQHRGIANQGVPGSVVDGDEAVNPPAESGVGDRSVDRCLVVACGAAITSPMSSSTAAIAEMITGTRLRRSVVPSTSTYRSKPATLAPVPGSVGAGGWLPWWITRTRSVRPRSASSAATASEEVWIHASESRIRRIAGALAATVGSTRSGRVSGVRSWMVTTLVPAGGARKFTPCTTSTVPAIVRRPGQLPRAHSRAAGDAGIGDRRIGPAKRGLRPRADRQPTGHRHVVAGQQGVGEMARVLVNSRGWTDERRDVDAGAQHDSTVDASACAVPDGEHALEEFLQPDDILRVAPLPQRSVDRAAGKSKPR